MRRGGQQLEKAVSIDKCDQQAKAVVTERKEVHVAGV
jgi:hypothetical protein